MLMAPGSREFFDIGIPTLVADQQLAGASGDWARGWDAMMPRVKRSVGRLLAARWLAAAHRRGFVERVGGARYGVAKEVPPL
jgi:hypothetical protein